MCVCSLLFFVCFGSIVHALCCLPFVLFFELLLLVILFIVVCLFVLCRVLMCASQMPLWLLCECFGGRRDRPRVKRHFTCEDKCPIMFINTFVCDWVAFFLNVIAAGFDFVNASANSFVDSCVKAVNFVSVWVPFFPWPFQPPITLVWTYLWDRIAHELHVAYRIIIVRSYSRPCSYACTLVLDSRCCHSRRNAMFWTFCRVLASYGPIWAICLMNPDAVWDLQYSPQSLFFYVDCTNPNNSETNA